VPIELYIVTPEGQAFSGPVEQVVLPGAEGDFGVLEGHERFLAPLRVGPVEIVEGSSRQWAAISDGFAEVNGEQVTVLVDECHLGSDIDTAQVTADRAELTSSLSDLTGAEEDQRRRAEIEGALALVDVKAEVAGK
jgi:F-type H+-transporting ATPase subunit epsilon